MNNVTEEMIKDLFCRYRNIEILNKQTKLRSYKETIEYITNNYEQALEWVNKEEKLRFKNISITYTSTGEVIRAYTSKTTDEEFKEIAKEMKLRLIPMLLKLNCQQPTTKVEGLNT